MCETFSLDLVLRKQSPATFSTSSQLRSRASLCTKCAASALKLCGCRYVEAGYIQRTQKLFRFIGASGPKCLFKDPQCDTRWPGIEFLPAEIWGKRCGGVLLRITGVRRPWKGEANDKTVHGKIHRGHNAVVSKAGAGAAQCYY